MENSIYVSEKSLDLRQLGCHFTLRVEFTRRNLENSWNCRAKYLATDFSPVQRESIYQRIRLPTVSSFIWTWHNLPVTANRAGTRGVERLNSPRASPGRHFEREGLNTLIKCMPPQFTTARALGEDRTLECCKKWWIIHTSIMASRTVPRISTPVQNCNLAQGKLHLLRATPVRTRLALRARIRRAVW